MGDGGGTNFGPLYNDPCRVRREHSSMETATQQIVAFGFLPFSNSVHYESGSDHGRAYHGLLREGMRPGYAAQDEAAPHFVGTELKRVVASRPAACGYRVDANGNEVFEVGLATTFLGDSPAQLPETPATAIAA